MKTSSKIKSPKPQPRYVSKPLTEDQVDKATELPGFSHYVENNHGNAYYNARTGEIVWASDEEDESNATLLPETWATLNA